MTKNDSILEEVVDNYHFLVDNILDVIVEIDLDGTFTYVNPKVYDMLGYQREEVIGNQFFSYIHPDDMDVIIESFEKAIEGKEAVALEYRVRHKEGHYITIFAKGSLVKVKGRLKLVGLLRDNTVQKVTVKLKRIFIYFFMISIKKSN